ncbi:AAA family ATPase [Desulfonatronum thioautotrophicum]|uniref:AAA family ATPase n=1 Tax=Desulfonatronum thioautotrophicum TaxID=617001 RepID=UPI00069A6FCB|nr:AAA family ATPase [Desulfonatronum thioautotrophicum]
MRWIKTSTSTARKNLSENSLVASALDAVHNGQAAPGSRTGRPRTRTIAIASGKGGAGKTSVAVCLAWSLAESGRNVCLVDVDLGLSNVDVLLGLTPRYTLEDVILGDVAMDQAITRVRPGLDVISGGSGAAALADLDPTRRNLFLSRIRSLEHYDFLLLDNAPGIHRQVVAFCLAAREQIIVINPEPTSVTDGYALLKVLHQNGLRQPPYLLVNRVADGFDHATLARRFAAVCKKHLRAVVLPLGAVPNDPAFQQAATQSTLTTTLHSPAPGINAVNRIASLLTRRKESEALYSHVEGFWTVSLNTLFQGLHLPGQAVPKPAAQKKTAIKDVLTRLDAVLKDLENLRSRSSGETAIPSETAHAADRLAEIGNRLHRLAATWKSGA